MFTGETLLLEKLSKLGYCNFRNHSGFNKSKVQVQFLKKITNF